VYEPKLVRPLGITVVLAAAVMFADLFIPFATQGCIFCPISGPGTTFVLPSFSLMQGLDGWRVLLVVVALAVEAIAYLASRRRIAAIASRRRIAAVASLVLAVIVLALGIFEGVDSAGRVVGLDAQAQVQPVELGGNGVVPHSITPPAHLIAGFYLFVAAASVAVVAAAAIVVLTMRANRSSAGTFSAATSAT
jgi:hypothetical protein